MSRRHASGLRSWLDAEPESSDESSVSPPMSPQAHDFPDGGELPHSPDTDSELLRLARVKRRYLRLWLGFGILCLGARIDLAMFGSNTGDDFIDLVEGSSWLLGGISLVCFFRFEWAWRKVAAIEAVYEAASGVSALPPDAVFSMLQQKQQWKLLWIPAASMVAGMVLSVLQGSLWQWGLRISFLDRFWLDGWVLILASFLYLIGAIFHLLGGFRHLPAGARRLLNGTQAEREAARARAAPEFLRFELIHAYASSPGFGIGRRILGCVLVALFVLAVCFVEGVRDTVRDVWDLSISP